MKAKYKYVIIGAGPAGMACAISLRNRGEDPCVIEKAAFPREKTCGGLVTKKTMRLLCALLNKTEKELTPIFSNRTADVALYAKKKLLVQASFEYPVRFAKRSVLDYALVCRYRAAGGTLLENCTDYEIDHARKRIRFAGGRVIRFQYLVFTDGAFSRSAHLLSFEMQDLTFGLETFVPAQQWPSSEMELYFGYADHGYIWAFPYGDEVCIGVGANYKTGTDYKKILYAFLKDHGINPKKLQFKGAFLPGGVPKAQEALAGHILLAGDAAGFADPISGEGLFFALLSGIAAAKALVTKDPKKAYLKSIAPVRKLLAEGRSLQGFFYRPSVQSYFIRHMRGNRRFAEYFFNTQVSEYMYSYQKIGRLYLDYKFRKKKRKKP